MTETASLLRRELPALSQKQFERVTRIARDAAGLTIAPAKSAMVQSRLHRRLRALGLNDFDSYLELVERKADGKELMEMVSVLTTNVSSFFREDHHFATLASEILPALDAQARRGERVRLWSAGCSTGEEPYSLAMLMLDKIPDAGDLDIRILATDIDAHVLDTAATGRFPAASLDGVPKRYRDKFFETCDDTSSAASVASEVRNLVEFRQLNLMERWPMRCAYDVIFCRNVVIYFDDAAQSCLWPRFQAQLVHDGWLFVGHSERVSNFSGRDLTLRGVTTYRRNSTSRGDR